MSSLSPRAGDDLRAVRHLEVTEDDGLIFRSVRHALRFFFERGAAMSAPLCHHPRGHQTADGAVVYIQVDGGRGSSIDEVHATLQSIRQAMDALADDRLALEMVELCLRDGMSQEEAGKAKGMSRQTVSVHLGRGISFLTGWLRAHGIVR